MDLSLYLAQLLGLYFVIVGGIVVLRRAALMPAVTEIIRDRALLLVLGAVELAAGLLIVLAHPFYTFDFRGLITLIGYWMVIESVLYLLAPQPLLRKVLKRFNTPTWYVHGGALSVMLGVYLTAVGFGLI